MAREKIPEEYESPLDLDALGNEARSGVMPIGRALAMLHRSTQLTQTLIDAICDDARNGYEWPAIAARVGVGKRTLANWLRRGEDRREAIDDWADRRRELPDDMPDAEVIAEIGEPPPEDDLLLFYDSVARAMANGECSLVDVIRVDALVNGNVRSAQWLLTTRYPSWRESKRNSTKIEAHDVSDVDVIDALEKKFIDIEQRQKALVSGGS